MRAGYIPSKTDSKASSSPVIKFSGQRFSADLTQPLLFAQGDRVLSIRKPKVFIAASKSKVIAIGASNTPTASPAYQLVQNGLRKDKPAQDRAGPDLRNHIGSFLKLKDFASFKRINRFFSKAIISIEHKIQILERDKLKIQNYIMNGPNRGSFSRDYVWGEVPWPDVNDIASLENAINSVKQRSCCASPSTGCEIGFTVVFCGVGVFTAFVSSLFCAVGNSASCIIPALVCPGSDAVTAMFTTGLAIQPAACGCLAGGCMHCGTSSIKQRHLGVHEELLVVLKEIRRLEALKQKDRNPVKPDAIESKAAQCDDTTQYITPPAQDGEYKIGAGLRR